MSTNRITCQDCSFWDYQGEGETDRGACRRRAPVPMAEDLTGAASAFWPDTRASDWCGDASTKDTGQ